MPVDLNRSGCAQCFHGARELGHERIAMRTELTTVILGDDTREVLAAPLEIEYGALSAALHQRRIVRDIGGQHGREFMRKPISHDSS